MTTWNYVEAAFLMRLDPADGTLDESFGSGGVVLNDAGNGAFGQVAQQSDGKILVTSMPGWSPFTVYRFTAAGVLDETFGADGEFTISATTQCSALAEGPEGKLYLTLGPYGSYPDSDFFLARLNTNGSLDTTFGAGSGYILTDIAGNNDFSCSLLVQEDGKVIVGGGAPDASGLLGGPALVRYTADGALDASFGSGGKVFTFADSVTVIIQLALTPGGKLLAAGLTYSGGNGITSLFRYDLGSITPPTHTISGYVFRDINKDGVHDLIDWPINLNWTVYLDQGCDGTIDKTTQTTLSGYYEFTNLPEDLCYRLSAETRTGWLQTTTLNDITLTGNVTQDIGNWYPDFHVEPEDALVGDVGVAYSLQYTTHYSPPGPTFETGPYTFSLISNSNGTPSILPAGLTLSADGLLSGTPTETGLFDITIQARDGNGALSYPRDQDLVISQDGSFDLTSSANPSIAGQPVTFTFSGTGDLVLPGGMAMPPVGFVTFYDNDVPITGCESLWLNVLDMENIGDYPATCTTANLGIGTHTIKAIFTDLGNGWYHNAERTLDQVVNPSVSADLQLTKVDSKDPVKPGAQLVYILTVSNLGPDAAESVALLDTLDRNTTYVSASAPRGWTCNHANGKVTCAPSASLAGGSSAVIKITVKVSKTARVGKELINNATVSSVTYDPDLTNNTVVQKTLVVK